MAIYKGDDTGAFGNTFIRINIKNPEGKEITKAQFVVNGGCPYLEPVANPVFPMDINFTSEQTEKMCSSNTGKLIVWDSNNLRSTCKGSITWDCLNGVICNVRRNCG